MQEIAGSPVQLELWSDDQATVLEPWPAVNGGFSETSKVRIAARSESECLLHVDDAPLAATREGEYLVWNWTPGFYAGEVRAELVDGQGRQLGRWRLDVSPDPGKMGQDLFRQMLEEIQDVDPELILGQEPARIRLGALGEAQSPLVALERLRSRHDPLGAALKRVVREPIRSLRPRRQLVPLHTVRRADHHTALGMLRNPTLLAMAAGEEAQTAAVPAHDLLVDVPQVERTVDCPANRCVRAMLQALLRRVNDTHRILEAQVHSERPAETTTALAERWGTWSRFLGQARDQYQLALRRAPFSQVSRAEITVAGLNAVSAHPLYARFWRLAWESLRTGVEGEGKEDLLPLSPTWEIYERWCYVSLCKKLKEWMPSLAWRRVSERCQEGRNGDGIRVQLLLQPTASCTQGEPRDRLWSVSRRRIPDIVLTWEGSSGSGFIVLDAKYRVSRENVLDAMQSAHIYQDALRMGQDRAEMSLLLVPEGGGAPWLEDEGAIKLHHVGVVPFRPGTVTPIWVKDSVMGFLCC